jgi:hypothetical protein
MLYYFYDPVTLVHFSCILYSQMFLRRSKRISAKVHGFNDSGSKAAGTEPEPLVIVPVSSSIPDEEFSPGVADDNVQT